MIQIIIFLFVILWVLETKWPFTLLTRILSLVVGVLRMAEGVLRKFLLLCDSVSEYADESKSNTQEMKRISSNKDTKHLEEESVGQCESGNAYIKNQSLYPAIKQLNQRILMRSPKQIPNNTHFENNNDSYNNRNVSSSINNCKSAGETVSLEEHTDDIPTGGERESFQLPSWKPVGNNRRSSPFENTQRAVLPDINNLHVSAGGKKQSCRRQRTVLSPCSLEPKQRRQSLVKNKKVLSMPKRTHFSSQNNMIRRKDSSCNMDNKDTRDPSHIDMFNFEDGPIMSSEEMLVIRSNLLRQIKSFEVNDRQNKNYKFVEDISPELRKAYLMTFKLMMYRLDEIIRVRRLQEIIQPDDIAGKKNGQQAPKQSRELSPRLINSAK
ncbi:hypothetical protein V1511DRAFT_506347 [Dipodascopsis uninucleata]